MSINYKNHEGYSDPTAFRALCAVVREKRKSAGIKHESPKVYISSPYRGDVETNVANARRYCKYAVEQGKFPIAPHLLLPQFMDDDNPDERQLALSFGIRLLYECSAIWVFGPNLTEGMKFEIAAAKELGIKIRQFDFKTEVI